MTITWSFGLRGIAQPGGEEHARLLGALWRLAPGNPDDGDHLVDRQRLDGADAFFEMDAAGRFGRAPEPRERRFQEAIAKLGDGGTMSWSNELAADFHVDVAPIGLPWFIYPSDESRAQVAHRLDLPGTPLDGRLAQFVRTQSSNVGVDEGSELLAAHGLTRNAAFGLNQRTLQLADLSVDHQLVMTYG